MSMSLYESYVPIVMEDGRDFCITPPSAIGVLEGDISEIKTAYRTKDVDGTLCRGEKVTSAKTLREIVRRIKADAEELRREIPERFWAAYHERKAVKDIRDAYNSHKVERQHSNHLPGISKHNGRNGNIRRGSWI